MQVFCDFFFHTILLFTLRRYFIANYSTKALETLTLTQLLGLYFTIILGPCSLFYICSRLLADLFSFTQVSWAVFRRNLFYRWTIVDILVVAMIVTNEYLAISSTSTVLTFALSSVQAISIGFIWLKFLGFLQVLNRRLATFIMSIFEVSQREREIGARASISRIP
jgi:hypothetical protein